MLWGDNVTTYKFMYRTEIGIKIFFYEVHMIVRRKITTWQRCAYQFSFTPDSINELTVGVRHVKFGIILQSYLHLREIIL